MLNLKQIQDMHKAPVLVQKENPVIKKVTKPKKVTRQYIKRDIKEKISALKVVKDIGYKKAAEQLGEDIKALYRWQHEMRLANVEI